MKTKLWLMGSTLHIMDPAKFGLRKSEDKSFGWWEKDPGIRGCEIFMLYYSKLKTQMASYKALNHSDHVRDSCFAHVRHGYSKAQMCLKKILGIISSIPVPQEPEIESFLWVVPKTKTKSQSLWLRMET